jgi:hypothetical protein
MQFDLSKAVQTVTSCLFLVAAASGSALGATYSIGGTVSGLKAGQSVTLLDNGVDTLNVTANGSFTFKTHLAPKATYDVTVSVQPKGQMCSVVHGTGTVGTGNVKTVLVECADVFSIGGTITGLAKGKAITLGNVSKTVTDSVSETGTGATINFTFPKALTAGSPYDVTVKSQPAGEVCKVANPKGTVGKNVNNVDVTCTAAAGHKIQVDVTGLQSGQSVTFLDNGDTTDPLKVTTTGTFSFTKELATGSKYDVTVETQPSTQFCGASLKLPNGIVGSTDVTVDFKCVPTYTIGGTITGLAKGQALTLADKISSAVTDLLPETGTGSTIKFTFKIRLPAGAQYDATIKSEPSGEKCTVSPTTARGTVSKNVTNIAVTCVSTATYPIGVTVAGLESGLSVLLDDTLPDKSVDPLTVTKNGTFTFPTKLASGDRYQVTVGTQPPGEDCTVVGGVGIAKSGVDIKVDCSTTGTVSIGGTVSGLAGSRTVTLVDNLAFGIQDLLPVNKNGSFAFKIKLAPGSSYNVGIETQPTGENCSLTGGTGTVNKTSITNITVTCVAAATYSIGGTISWPASGVTGSVTLATNGESKTVAAGTTSFTFPTPLATGTVYAITVTAQPTGGTCTVTNDAGGTVGTKNITDVAVTCTATAPQTYSISGTISWPASGVTGSVTLATNGESKTVAAGTTSFTFPTPLATGTVYAITVTAQPTGGTCTVTNDAGGTIGTKNITDVAVTCTASGGGGGGNGFWIPYEASSKLTFSLGGTISWPASGVTGSVTLSDGLDYVSVPAGTASFAFSTNLATGTQYAVSVYSQPTGGSCTVTGNASGVVDTSNITNVAVTCTATTSPASGGGGSSLAIPRLSKPLPIRLARRAKPFFSPQTIATGSTGLFVIPSDKISSSPAPTWITTDPVQIHAIGVNIDFSSGGLTTYIPKLIVYSDTDFSGNTKVYGLDISDTSKTPTPVQISSLALDSTQQICEGFQGQVNLSDPTTIFVLLHIAPTGTCFVGTGTFEVVHYTDSSSTAPTKVSLETGGFDELYNNGVQSGILVYDDVADTVSLYADETFTSPKTLFSGVTSAFAEASGVAKKGYTTETSELFYEVTTAPTTSNPSGSTLYLIDSSGTPSQIFQGPVGSTANDDNNFYFVSTTGYSATDTSTLYQVGLSGGTPSALYVGPTTITAGTPAQTYDLQYGLTGSNDSVLIFSTNYGNLFTGTAVTTLYNVPVGAKTTKPTTIASYDNSLVETFLGTPSSGSQSDDVLFVSFDTLSISTTGASYAWSSVAFPSVGPYTATPLAKSFYGDMGILTRDVGGLTWRVKDIQGSKEGFGGGTFYLTDIGTLTDTAVTTTGGGNYTFPVPNSPTDNGYLTEVLLGLSNYGVAVGEFGDVGGGLPDIGVAIDTTNNFLYPITLPNTDVLF